MRFTVDDINFGYGLEWVYAKYKSYAWTACDLLD